LNRYFLGIDGGQSSTTALIANENGQIVGQGRGGPCNHASGDEGRRKFFNAVGSCVRQACEQAGLVPGEIQFESACLGLSGGAADKRQYSRELIRADRLEITHDAEIALTGAIAGEPGLIVIAGTGSMAFGRNARGRTARAGGWGYVFGDEGGGFDLTRQALRAALRMEEGWGPETTLRALLLASTGSSDINSLLHRFYTSDFTRPQIAAFSQLVTQATEAGDFVAAEILRAAATELATYVKGVYTTLFHADERIEVAYIGGVFRSTPLLARFTELVRDQTGITPGPPRFGPAAGAVIQAMRATGVFIALSNVPEAEK
jgi:N-acetylglucosamine kinase-like BadF-type ATPase